MTLAPLSLQAHNPDVLTCIANLSNDEIFTPPEFANQMLDALADAWANDNDGANIWADPDVTFLDPFTKSGVFLREIVRRLIDGLSLTIPDLSHRVDHVLTRQVFGIGITQLTALLARRSVYCSKFANGPHSIATSFTTEDGNIWFERTEHAWGGGRREFRVDPLTGEEVAFYTGRSCVYCGAAESDYARGGDLETHAYAFIHTGDITARIAELFGDNMQFDVIIGNPPYQLSDGGHGTSAAPIYQLFVEQAKKLDPRFLSMVIPSRWFAGGKGLDEFRESMLKDRRLRSIDDFLSAADVFPGVGLKGGVNYFLWDRDHPGECVVSTHFKGWADSTATRPLLEEDADIFVRFNEGVSILKKVMLVELEGQASVSLPPEMSFSGLVSSARAFGLRTFFKAKSVPAVGDLKVYQNGGVGYIPRHEVPSGHALIDKWKIFVSYAAPGTGNKDSYPHRVISTPFLGEPGSVSTETYLPIGPFDSEGEAESALSYLSCRLTRLLIQLRKASQHVTSKVYGFVPVQDWTGQWTDSDLYAKYGLTDEEIAFVERVVRPMGLGIDE
ncbi:Eco57I restriction-modification methylase domain-containing protein [Curtobacterium aurantiacum]|uniref:Eco57I restriction-modification methylase domain-containing protein n=1 Tax=Curtobacterium aurantiacum TaxID=3236919 RepID=UPI001BDE86A0|nr:Eco57I restriction-modification methylase domain-containing protein [Curtobacterium flaccumfaciens]MBT1679795.1 Eco57I restriction-modification methylase domain-containing protein [Curtobacterium flaccumfaciens pv. flaccumfaciens]